MICLKISTFVVSTTTPDVPTKVRIVLWFAWKYLPLWYQQQLGGKVNMTILVVICLKISTFVVSTTTFWVRSFIAIGLWFAWKYLPLWYQQQQSTHWHIRYISCDLLENIYLCGINNNRELAISLTEPVVICLKISTFVVSTTTKGVLLRDELLLWFAWKYLPLWYQQQRYHTSITPVLVVICLKISTFVVSTTTSTQNSSTYFWLWFAWKYLPLWYQQQPDGRRA